MLPLTEVVRNPSPHCRCRTSTVHPPTPLVAPVSLSIAWCSRWPVPVVSNSGRLAGPTLVSWATLALGRSHPLAHSPAWLQELEMTDGYRRLTEQLEATLGELSALVSAEKYEEACEVRYCSHGATPSLPPRQGGIPGWGQGRL